MKIFIVGGKKRTETNEAIPAGPQVFPFNEAAHSLGHCAASRGHTILVASENPHTADYQFMQGVLDFANEPSAPEVFVNIYHPGDKAPIPYGGIKNANIHISHLPYTQPRIKEYRQVLTHAAAINDCDAVICLGGGIGSYIAGTIAANRGIPVMAVRASGGSAQELYDILRNSYPPSPFHPRMTLNIRRILGEQWGADSALNIIKSLEVLAHSVDFAIICPLLEERKAIIHALKAAGCAIERVDMGRETYWRAQCSSESGPPHSVVVAQLSAMGNVASALSASDIIIRWRPRAVLVVGIAGTLSNEVKLGDVVVGSSVLYNELGKEQAGVLYPEPYMYPADALLYGQAQTLPSGERPERKVHFGVILAGEKVVAAKSLRAKLARIHRKLLAVEMESAGVSASVQNSIEPVRQLTIRGISDLATEQKALSDSTQPWRKKARKAAAEFAVHFMRYCRL